jgi:hypothetical protein
MVRTGRAVVGKAAVPAELAGRKDWLFGFCYLVRKPVNTAPASATRNRSSPRRDGASFTFKVEADGSFRIEDVPVGTYELLVTVNKEPDDKRGLGTETLATALRDVIVPLMPDGPDVPFDLGVLKLTAVTKPEVISP